MSDLLVRMKHWLQYPRLSSGEKLMGEAVTELERLWARLDVTPTDRRCSVCGTGLLHSAAKHGDSLCHYCAHESLAECRRLLREAWESMCNNQILPRRWAEKTLQQITTAAKAGGE